MVCADGDGDLVGQFAVEVKQADADGVGVDFDGDEVAALGVEAD